MSQDAAELVQYLPMIRGEAMTTLRRCPPVVDLDDLVSAGTVGAWRALRQGTRGDGFAAYVRIKARGAILDELRAQDWLGRGARASAERSGRGAMFVRIDDLPAGQSQAWADESATSPEGHAELRSDCAAMGRAMSMLPAREANILLWSYCDGEGLSEIAMRLGVSPQRVTQLRSRARATVREAMGAGADA